MAVEGLVASYKFLRVACEPKAQLRTPYLSDHRHFHDPLMGLEVCIFGTNIVRYQLHPSEPGSKVLGTMRFALQILQDIWHVLGQAVSQATLEIWLDNVRIACVT